MADERRERNVRGSVNDGWMRSGLNGKGRDRDRAML